jgi:hypothetical protein
MFRLGARHVRQIPLEPDQETKYVWFFYEVGLEGVFNDLHFTNSPNAPPLIVQSS